MKTKVIFVPGNGGASTKDGWFLYLNDELTKLGMTVVAETFPDPQLARREYWLPFLEKIGADENSILIGHSSGAVAAMRYAETHRIKGSVLVAPCYTDLGIESEKASGYYDGEWKWDDIRGNQDWVTVFASTNDPFIPIQEARFVAEELKAEYVEMKNQEHFGYPSPKLEFPEIVDVIKKRI